MPRQVELFGRYSQRKPGLPRASGQTGGAGNSAISRHLPAWDGGNNIPNQLERRILLARRSSRRA